MRVNVEQLEDETKKLMLDAGVLKQEKDGFYLGETIDRYTEIVNEVYDKIENKINELLQVAHMYRKSEFVCETFRRDLVSKFPNQKLGERLVDGLICMYINQRLAELSKKDRLYVFQFLQGMLQRCDFPIDVRQVYCEIEFNLEQPGYA